MGRAIPDSSSHQKRPAVPIKALHAPLYGYIAVYAWQSLRLRHSRKQPLLAVG